MYRKIALVTGYTYDEIANMSPAQQCNLLGANSDARTVTFASEEDYLKWLREKDLDG